jgi:hypothetical protein
MDAAAAAPRIAVLVPAHNEAAVIAGTVRHLDEALTPGDRILVVADNCSDDTAERAAIGRAEVIVRTDPENRGKGYALDFGVRHLSRAAPDVVIVFDADCRSDQRSLATVAALADATGRPVQARYEMRLPPGLVATPGQQLSAFAWWMKSILRPAGLHRLGLPCQLAGTGMAFPWQLIAAAPLATSNIVEDLTLGLTLAAQGTGALYCPDAAVASSFPAGAEARQSQRTRWETGHLQAILHLVPRVIASSARKGRWSAVALAIDAAVPPLALLALLIALAVAAGGLLALAGGSVLPLAAALLAGAALTGATLAALRLTARRSDSGQSVSARDLLAVPGYVLAKLGIYASVLRGTRLAWIKTKRDQPGGNYPQA